MCNRKFGQNPNKVQHEIMRRNNSYEKIADNPDFVIKNVQHLDFEQDVMLLVYENADGSSAVDNFRTNIVIASFVTMYARMKLYNLLDSVDSHADAELLYFDTVFLLLFCNFYFNNFYFLSLIGFSDLGSKERCPNTKFTKRKLSWRVNR